MNSAAKFQVRGDKPNTVDMMPWLSFSLKVCMPVVAASAALRKSALIGLSEALARMREALIAGDSTFPKLYGTATVSHDKSKIQMELADLPGEWR